MVPEENLRLFGRIFATILYKAIFPQGLERHMKRQNKEVFFVSGFTVEDTGQVPTSELCYFRGKSLRK